MGLQIIFCLLCIAVICEFATILSSPKYPSSEKGEKGFSCYYSCKGIGCTLTNRPDGRIKASSKCSCTEYCTLDGVLEPNLSSGTAKIRELTRAKKMSEKKPKAKEPGMSAAAVGNAMAMASDGKQTIVAGKNKFVATGDHSVKVLNNRHFGSDGFDPFAAVGLKDPSREKGRGKVSASATADFDPFSFVGVADPMDMLG